MLNYTIRLQSAKSRLGNTTRQATWFLLQKISKVKKTIEGRRTYRLKERDNLSINFNVGTYVDLN